MLFFFNLCKYRPHICTQEESVFFLVLVFRSGAKFCGKCSSLTDFVFYFFFDSGNLAKVNRMSTAHMQGEHLIKGTHTLGEKSGKVLRGSRRSCCQKHVRYVT